MSEAQNWLEQVKWDDKGLVPAIAQDHASGQLLMMAWMDREALATTVQENRAVYYSRSRKKLWRKGEESGHVQTLKDIRLDCDNDVIVMQVEQIGGIACHTGRAHCFFQRLTGEGEAARWEAVEPVLKPADEIYAKKTK